MEALKFRVLLDTKDSEEVFRDIEIKPSMTFRDFHETIVDSFDFDGEEMASFYMSNDKWEKGEEIPLMDMDPLDEEDDITSMEDAVIGKYMRKAGQKVLYVYDFLRMWVFMIELVEMLKEDPEADYPRVVMALGEPPSEKEKDMDLGLEPDDEDEDDDEEDED